MDLDSRKAPPSVFFPYATFVSFAAFLLLPADAIGGDSRSFAEQLGLQLVADPVLRLALVFVAAIPAVAILFDPVDHSPVAVELVLVCLSPVLDLKFLVRQLETAAPFLAQQIANQSRTFLLAFACIRQLSQCNFQTDIGMHFQ